MNEIVTVLKEFGFPAVMCGMFFYLSVVTISKNTKALDRLTIFIKILYDKTNPK